MDNRIRLWGARVNAFLLAVVAVGIALAAYERYHAPPRVLGWSVFVTALLAGALNWWQHHELERKESRERARYIRVLGIGIVTSVLLFVSGHLSGSLSLMSDGWHVVTDNAAILISIGVTLLTAERHEHDHATHRLLGAHVLSDLAQNGLVIFAGLWIICTGQDMIDVLASFAVALILGVWAGLLACKSDERHHHHHEHEL